MQKENWKLFLLWVILWLRTVEDDFLRLCDDQECNKSYQLTLEFHKIKFAYKVISRWTVKEHIPRKLIERRNKIINIKLSKRKEKRALNKNVEQTRSTY